MIRLQLPLYTCCEKPSPSSSWFQGCDTSSSGGSNEDTAVSLYTVHPPSSPVHSGSCRLARLNKKDDNSASGGRVGEYLGHQSLMQTILPSSCSEKIRNVLSSFRFLLNSMESSLMSLELFFISLEEKQKERHINNVTQLESMNVYKDDG